MAADRAIAEGEQRRRVREAVTRTAFREPAHNCPGIRPRSSHTFSRGRFSAHKQLATRVAEVMQPSMLIERESAHDALPLADAEGSGGSAPETRPSADGCASRVFHV